MMFQVRIDKDGDGYVFKVQPAEDGLEMVALDSAPGIMAVVQAESPGAAAERAWDRGVHMYDHPREQLPDHYEILRRILETP